MQCWELRPSSTNAASPAASTDPVDYPDFYFLGTGSHGPTGKPQLHLFSCLLCASLWSHFGASPAAARPEGCTSRKGVLTVSGPVAKCGEEREKEGEGICLWKPDKPVTILFSPIAGCQFIFTSFCLIWCLLLALFFSFCFSVCLNIFVFSYLEIIKI